MNSAFWILMLFLIGFVEVGNAANVQNAQVISEANRSFNLEEIGSSLAKRFEKNGEAEKVKADIGKAKKYLGSSKIKFVSELNDSIAVLLGDKKFFIISNLNTDLGTGLVNGKEIRFKTKSYSDLVKQFERAIEENRKSAAIDFFMPNANAGVGIAIGGIILAILAYDAVDLAFGKVNLKNFREELETADAACQKGDASSARKVFAERKMNVEELKKNFHRDCSLIAAETAEKSRAELLASIILICPVMKAVAACVYPELRSQAQPGGTAPISTSR